MYSEEEYTDIRNLVVNCVGRINNEVADAREKLFNARKLLAPARVMASQLNLFDEGPAVMAYLEAVEKVTRDPVTIEELEQFDKLWDEVLESGERFHKSREHQEDEHHGGHYL